MVEGEIGNIDGGQHEYDEIAESYHEGRREDSRLLKHVLIPNFLRLFNRGDHDKVLDLACGTGTYSRIAKQHGASEVVGVDISSRMLRLAQEQEFKEPLGIEYVQHDAANLPELGAFDLVHATFLLHYARTKDELLKLCQGAYRNLKDGGRFTFINGNPDHQIRSSNKYGFTIEFQALSAEEGSQRIVSIYPDDSDDKACSFTTYYWRKDTYQWALKEAGFRIVGWSPARVTSEGMEQEGEEFWQDYMDAPDYVAVECVK